MAESFGGGFAGDRAGLMNLENVLGNITQNAMQSRMFNAQLNQQDFERMMAGKQFGLQQKQFGLASRIEPWEAIGNLLGWGTQGAQRLPLAKDFYQMLMGGKPTEAIPGEDLPGSGVDINATTNVNGPPPTSSFADRHPGIRLGVDTLGTIGGGMLGARFGGKPLIGAGIGGGITDFILNQIGKQPVLPNNAPMSNAMGLPQLPGSTAGMDMDSIAQSGIPSIAPNNVNKRNARKAGGSTGAAVKPPATISPNVWQ